MISLMACDYQELLTQQPVSRSALATLQNGALNGDSICSVWFRKHMISLGAYLALESTKKHHMDQEYVLAHIDADNLEKIGFSRSFSEWGDENVHIDIVQRYIQQVVDMLYVKTHDDVYIEKKAYQNTANVWTQWVAVHQKAPSAGELVLAAGVTEEIAAAVQRNETWKKEQEERRKKEEQRLHKLKEIIRDSDMPFSKKLDFLESLVRMPKQMRPFFYALYGVDDGIPKSIEEIAELFSMTPGEAQTHFQKVISLHHIHYRSCVTQDRYYDLMEELRDFLLENEENKREYQKHKESVKSRSSKLKEYID